MAGASGEERSKWKQASEKQNLKNTFKAPWSSSALLAHYVTWELSHSYVSPAPQGPPTVCSLSDCENN